MGRKKKKQMKPWCWYCNREFDDEKILLEHQKARHFRCHICHKKLFTGPGLQIHSQQIHNETIKKISNAVKGRESVEIEIHGMEGIPEADLLAHERRSNGKDKDDYDTTDNMKIPSSIRIPPISPIGMVPMPFTGIPYGMPPISLPMMSLQMIRQLPPPPSMSVMPKNTINNDSNSLLTNTSDTSSDIKTKIEPVASTAKLIHPDDDISLEEFRASLPKYKQMMMAASFPAGFIMPNFIPPHMTGLPFVTPTPSISSMTFNGVHF